MIKNDLRKNHTMLQTINIFQPDHQLTGSGKMTSGDSNHPRCSTSVRQENYHVKSAGTGSAARLIT